MGKHTKIYLSVGSNIGNRLDYLDKAGRLLQKAVGPILRSSQVYETAAWGNTGQADFLNQVLELKTGLAPQELLKTCLKVEASLGRFREDKWGPRSVDVDILFYGETVIDEKNLQVPHPRLHLRNFVLIPLHEIAPELVHPLLQQDIETLLQNCQDPLEVALPQT